MKTKSKKKLGICGILLLALAGVICFSIMNKKEERLSKSEIDKLRDKYPACSIIENAPELASMIIMPIDEVKEECDTFIYGEVVGNSTVYDKDTSTGIAELDEKGERMGLSNTDEFFDYTIAVLKDTEGIYQEGDQVTITANSMFKNCTPQLSDGMKVVIPIFENEYNGKTSIYYIVEGMYYVTDQDYAISCTEDQMRGVGQKKMRFAKSFNGIKVDDLLNDLKK